MVCTNCGALIPEHAPTCPSCARPLRVREVLESPPNLTAAHNDQYRGVGGWLGLLVFYLLVFLPLGTGMQLVRGVRPILAGESGQQAASLPNLTYWIVALLVTLIGIYAGIALWRVFPNAVVATKFFLVVFLVAGVALAVYQNQILKDRLWGMVDSLTFFLVWYVYLIRSKRVANTYPRHRATKTLPA